MTNKALWDRVCMTDPRAVKPITGKQYQGNSPKPYWLIERATEVFGPVGVGWGVIVKSERFERLSETDVLHVAVVSVWYLHDGKRTETFDQMGGTKAAYKTAKGPLMIDEDAGKKSVTDGMVKCLSMIGFAGDIFSGRWDDSKYVASAREHFAERAGEDSLVPVLEASIIAAKAKAVEKPNFPKVADLVLADNEELTAETKDYLNELAASIQENFFKSGPAKAVDRIDGEGLSPTQYIYMADQLPSPMRNAIKKASAGRYQTETTS